MTAWGNSDFGQLGDGSRAPHLVPTFVPGLENVIQVAAGDAHSVALLANGQVWAWGRNDEGQVGDNSTTDRWSPSRVKIDCNLGGVIAIAAGGDHSLALCHDGSVLAWGRGDEGQVGDGAWTSRTAPTPIGLDGVIGIVAGARHSLALHANGTVSTWGANDSHQLGDGAQDNRGTPHQIEIARVVAIAGGSAHSLALLASGEVAAWGANASGQIGDGTFIDADKPVVLSTDPIVAIAAGGDQSLAVRMDGALLSWGWDPNGTLVSTPTDVPFDRAVTDVAAGSRHDLAMDGYGELWAWGENALGQVGDGTTIDALVPTRTIPSDGLVGRTAIDASFSHMHTIRPDATLWAWGEVVGHGLPALTTTIPAIKAVAAGAKHQLALRADGTVWSRGTNGHGQLGDGTLDDRSHFMQVEGLEGVVAIDAGEDYSMALRADGTLWGWGSNTQGQLGDGTGSDSVVPVQVLMPAEVVAFSAGAEHVLAVAHDGTVFAWGLDASGQLGDGSFSSCLSPKEVKDLPCPAVEVAAGTQHSLALCVGAQVYAWGVILAGGSSPLPVAVGDPNLVSIAAGENHSEAIRADGRVVGWGHNEYGQLGDETTFERASPVEAWLLENALAITAGSHFSAALRADGKVVSWGTNASGQLGDGTNTTRRVPGQPIKVFRHHYDLAAGASQGLAIGPKDELLSWGYNFYHQLGRVTLTAFDATPAAVEFSPGVATAAGGTRHSLAVRIDGTLWSWGTNNAGQLGDHTIVPRNLPVQVTDLRDVRAVAAGDFHSLAVLVDGTVYAWGNNLNGQLGNGSSGSSTNWTPAPVSGLDHVVAVAAGATHSLALRGDGTVYSWGGNTLGQLGTGPGGISTVPTPVSMPCHVSAIAAGSDHSLALCTTGSVYAWGNNGSWQLGSQTPSIRWTPVSVANLSTTVVAIAAGSGHSMVLYSTGTVAAWGSNGRGQLGDGSGSPQQDHPVVSVSVTPNPSLANVGAIAAGSLFSLASSWDGPSFAWGEDNFGQLGIGTPGPYQQTAVLCQLP